MSDRNDRLDRLILQERLRKMIPVVIIVLHHAIVGEYIPFIVLLFTVFMVYALYIEYGPEADVVDIFPEVE